MEERGGVMGGVMGGINLNQLTEYMAYMYITEKIRHGH